MCHYKSLVLFGDSHVGVKDRIAERSVMPYMLASSYRAFKNEREVVGEAWDGHLCSIDDWSGGDTCM